jgi:adenosylmethionine-8-amino-7-oxononanoate aminotransferase
MAEALGRLVADCRGVKAIRQVGLMAGIELDPIGLPSGAGVAGAMVCERVRAHGVILRQLGDVVVWMPPLTIQTAEMALLEKATRRAIEETFARST